MKRAAIAALLVVGCRAPDPPSGFGVNLTIDARMLSQATLQSIQKAHVYVSGEMPPYDRVLDVSQSIQSGQTRTRYVPGAASGVLGFHVDALDGAQTVVASGDSAGVNLQPGRSVGAVVVLGSPMPLDGGVNDGGLKQKGQACTTSSECATAGGCLDGYCCESGCASACQACNVAGKEGTCMAVPPGQMPASGHPSCGAQPAATCQHDGACDGLGNCRLWAVMTPQCNSTTNTFTPGSQCDGRGTCAPPTGSISCAPYVCKDATSCNASCSSSAQCSSPNVCASGSCGPKQLGATCAGDGECGSGHCSPDKVCCDAACTGQCEACNSSGHCQPISGQPVGGRTACTGQGAPPCGGSCNGTSSFCSYPTAVCAAASCGPGVLGLLSESPAVSCNNGMCPSVQNTACCYHKCNSSNTTCAYPCASNSDCVSGTTCNTITGQCCSTTKCSPPSTNPC